MQSQANLVLIGGGIVGSSAAYHLAQKGWTDVVVLDKGELPDNDGSTSHAPGGMHVTNGSEMMTRMAMYSRELYSSLTDYDPDAYPMVRLVGGIEVAHTRERLEHDLKRKIGWAKAYGVEAQLITPQEARELVPILNADVLHGALYVPADTNVNGWHVAGALAREAERIGGVTFEANTPFRDLEIENGRVKAVLCEQNGEPVRIATDNVLFCANIWGPALTERFGIRIPLLSAQHQYTITQPLPELASETKEVRLPLVRYQDHAMYSRQHYDAWGIGSYNHAPMMVRPRDVGKTADFPFTPNDFAPAWAAAQELFPPLAHLDMESGLVKKFNGMFCFGIDGYPILGETSVKGMWTALGVWITHAGGVGRAIAEMMSDGVTTLDMHEADINRFHSHEMTRSFVLTRASQNYREVYDIIHPDQQMENPRGLRLSPVQPRLELQQAVFWPSKGYEVARWYEANSRLLEQYDEQVPERDEWSGRYWSRIQGAEHLAVRDGVGLFNLHTLAVIEVTGPGARAYLERLSANKVGRAVGKVTYTQFLDEQGGIRCDLVVARRGPQRFWVITGGGNVHHDLAWMRQHQPRDGSVQIVDLSAGWTTLGLWGPKARQVMEQVTEADLSNEGFGYFTGRDLTVDGVPSYAQRLSYAGELGWEIYAPTEFGLHLWDVLWEAGSPHDIVAAGTGAFDSLRLEKGYRLWGADIHPGHNPFEAGLDFAVRLQKDDFIGREALLRAQENGLSRKLCALTFDEPESMAMGREPILSVDDGSIGGSVLGFVTSANYGYSLGQMIAYGYLPIDYAEPGTLVEVEYLGRRQRATVRAEPLFDAEMVRLKA